MRRKTLKPSDFLMLMIGIFHRILKSTGFNVFMLILGFVVGFSYAAFMVHQHAMHNDKYDLVQKISDAIDETDRLDALYDDQQAEVRRLVKELLLNLSHDDHNVDCLFRKETYTNVINKIIHL